MKYSVLLDIRPVKNPIFSLQTGCKTPIFHVQFGYVEYFARLYLVRT